MKVWRIVGLALLALLLPVLVQAQEDCPQIVLAAMEQTADACEGMEANSVCYGYNWVELVSSAEGLVFAAPGDQVALADIDGLRLAAFDEGAEAWGMALMQVQADIPGTIPGQLVTMVLFGDVEVMQQAAADDEWATMQAFAFRSGISDTACDEMPNSGLLVQTPSGVASLTFTINGVQVAMGSTIYLTADAGGPMELFVLEGTALVQAQGAAVEVPAGGFVTVPLSDDYLPLDVPSEVQPYDMTHLVVLPFALLPEEIEPAPPLGSPEPDSGGSQAAAMAQAMAPVSEVETSVALDEGFFEHVVDLGNCFGDTWTAGAGQLYLGFGDGPHYASAIPLFEFAISMNGVTLPPVTSVYLGQDGHLHQFFDAGVLAPGEYALTMTGSVSTTITDPLGQSWGPSQWSHSCTLVLE